MKVRLTNSPVLCYVDYNNKFILETDASFRGLGAVLMQEQKRIKRVLTNEIRTLRTAERNDETKIRTSRSEMGGN